MISEEVKGVWDDVPVLGAYPISWKEEEFISLFRYPMSHLENCFHFC